MREGLRLLAGCRAEIAIKKLDYSPAAHRAGWPDMINRFMKPEAAKNSHPKRNTRPLGMFKGERFYAEGYNLDEDNEEIAKMFEVME